MMDMIVDYQCDIGKHLKLHEELLKETKMSNPVTEGIVGGLEYLQRAQGRAAEYEDLIETLADAYSAMVYIVEGREVDWSNVDDQ